ncbi:uncharacterized protein G2W53_022191 [Senna tora]|uniref:Uncharacterized protein n=1 Tax=Senna tora TaxID=362788 RepID=A0A834WII1_9FABA|nr:uncharacterized protein G2W53_022191 [Senna tora]
MGESNYQQLAYRRSLPEFKEHSAKAKKSRASILSLVHLSTVEDLFQQ